jgi:DNA-directed RNA polymerase specialized sigma24 family protein
VLNIQETDRGRILQTPGHRTAASRLYPFDKRERVTAIGDGRGCGVYEECFDGAARGCGAGTDVRDGVLRRVFDIASSVARNRFRLDPCDAEEIGQEMMLRAFHQLRVASINVAWVSRGAQFLCIDLLRSRRSEQRAMELIEKAARRVTSPASIQDLDLAHAIASLPSPCQDLLRMYFWEGRTWAEMDAILDGGRRCAQYQTRKCLAALTLTLSGAIARCSPPDNESKSRHAGDA